VDVTLNRQQSGRIRDLTEARDALGIPDTYSAEALQKQGVPADFWLQAYPVSDPQHPERVAEFAILRVVVRSAGRLRPRVRERLHVREASNALWVVYGSLALSAHNGLVIETLHLAPAYDRQFSNRDDEIARGITTELLRLLSLSDIISNTVQRLQQQGHHLAQIEQHGGPPIPPAQREILESIAAAATPRTKTTDDDLAEIAERYLVLCRLGIRNPLPRLGDEFGITRSQARDRIHKARQKGYLAPGDKGRATAIAGPALLELGWTDLFSIVTTDPEEKPA
jgi:hypothetical protein